MNQSTYPFLASALFMFLLGCGGSATSAPVVTIPTPTPTNSARQWTWINGNAYSPTGLGQAGVYGIQGTPAATNSPGSRGVAYSWSDSSGNLWMFGGFGLDAAGVTVQEMNDLWKYNLTTNQWTWVKGSSSGTAASVFGTLGVGASTNIPGGRQVATGWTDASGNAWVFGGLTTDANLMLGQGNDLWVYAPSSNTWTWMGGSKSVYAQGTYGTKGTPSVSNIPSAREQSVGWTDTNGNFWMFGGYGIVFPGGTSDLNDLWRYSPTSQQWTWINGTNMPAVPGAYGALGVSSSANQPGGRELATAWSDGSGNFWLFGGYGIDSAGKRARLNDLWEFSTTTLQWTWIAGSNQGDTLGTYGVQGVANTTNVPGARSAATGWKDGSGNLWLFGGNGGVSTATPGDLADLWSFSTSTKQWTWVGGTTQLNTPGTYGIKGTSDAANLPGGREGAIPFTDNSGTFWLFGGFAANASGPLATGVSDLWRYQP